ncbi:ABC transporter ATP-binding protein [Flexilinea flocculi]|jgi:putative ABC transport system ATP-binding protein|uniref:ABC-type lipoprotein export system, ATPase component n=1 Tax=Flexilinea flocculi TaxID=1678840 RepID=A0A0K8PCX3_9CHLR|nr:ABC transporter ATP-binding protein [Flexilinea flocculi]NMB93855.1 ABC transporter ATP-binding protein [Flexilinea flocculi]GAP39995.1 ABC-type lipoprotein export system, ATPase component [Flexilinea flocculi]
MSVIQTENLTKIYGKNETAVTALDRVNIQIEEGEFVAVMGPSGCGKSTLMHLLGGLDKPTSGIVRINQISIAEMGDDELTKLRRRKIGFVFQFFNLIPVLDAAENAALPMTLDGMKPDLARKKACEWLERFGMANRMKNRPDQLSGGQQQRVAIARALVADPTIILADEPTGNLDTHSGDEIAGLLRNVSNDYNRTVIMVTHDPRIAAYANRIIFLKDGSVIDETILEKKNDNNAGLVADKMKKISD